MPGIVLHALATYCELGLGDSRGYPDLSRALKEWQSRWVAVTIAEYPKRSLTLAVGVVSIFYKLLLFLLSLELELWGTMDVMNQPAFITNHTATLIMYDFGCAVLRGTVASGQRSRKSWHCSPCSYRRMVQGGRAIRAGTRCSTVSFPQCTGFLLQSQAGSPRSPWAPTT